MWTNDKGAIGSGPTQGTAYADSNGGLTTLTVVGKDDKKIIEKGLTVSAGSDGIVGWGRWVEGQSDVNGSTGANGSAKGKITTLHYFAFAAQPSAPVFGAFASFASTAPTVTSGGTLTATGALNAASGTVSVSFPTANLGSASYSLTVPVAGQTFMLNGMSTQIANFGFSGTSFITSTGTGCTSGCTGNLGGGNAVMGLVGGSAGNRLGVAYGFDSRIGNVSGVIVFKH